MCSVRQHSVLAGNPDVMKRTIAWVIAAMMLAAVGVVFYNHANRERLFLDDAFVQLRGGGGCESVTTIQLESGDSAAVILEHDCCSGAGFDAVAIRTSDGREFSGTRSYCGLEGFSHELSAEAVKDLASFTTFLSAHGFRGRLKNGGGRSPL